MSVPGKDTRVVITGLGVISPIGLDAGEFWRSLTAAPAAASSNVCGEQASHDRFPRTHVADLASVVQSAQALPEAKRTFRKAIKLMDRETLLGVAAAIQALATSDIVSGDYDPDRVGACFGAENIRVAPGDFVAGVGACTGPDDQFDIRRWGSEGMPNVAPLWLLKCLPNMAACHLAILGEVRGPNNTITQRDNSANLALAEAYWAIAEGDADAMVVGATGTTLTRPIRSDGNPQKNEPDESAFGPLLSIPFDRRRRGPLPAEGAAAMVLERWDAAAGRGAQVFGEVCGAASAAAPSRHGRPDCQAALENAIRLAISRAGISPADVGHIHAHGLGARELDISEARAIRNVFGATADELPVVAAKSYLGNAGAGSGGLELVASLLALKAGRLFPVHHLEELDPDCPISPVTTHDRPSGTSFLNLNMVPQGLASCVAIRAAA